MVIGQIEDAKSLEGGQRVRVQAAQPVVLQVKFLELVQFRECSDGDVAQTVHAQLEEFERLHRLERRVLDPRDGVIREIQSLDQQQVPEQRSLETG